jgi:hypothetical protein
MLKLSEILCRLRQELVEWAQRYWFPGTQIAGSILNFKAFLSWVIKFPLHHYRPIFKIKLKAGAKEV